MDDAPAPHDDADGSLPAIMRALADDSRIRIMLLILETELAVGEIAQILEQSQPRAQPTYPHIVRCRLAERRREGQLDVPAARQFGGAAGVAQAGGRLRFP